MKATVAEKREVAKGTLLVLFAVDGYPEYRPGHYFWVELPDRGHQDDKGLRRHISLVTSPTEAGVVGLATRHPRHRLQAHARPSSRSATRSRSRSRRARSSCPRTRTSTTSSSPAGSGSPSFARCCATSPTRSCRTASRSSTRTATASRPPSSTSSTSSSSASPGCASILTMTDEAGWEGETRQLDAEVLARAARWPRRQAIPHRRAAGRWPRRVLRLAARCRRSRRISVRRGQVFSATDTLQIPGKL